MTNKATEELKKVLKRFETMSDEEFDKLYTEAEKRMEEFSKENDQCNQSNFNIEEITMNSIKILYRNNFYMFILYTDYIYLINNLDSIKLKNSYINNSGKYLTGSQFIKHLDCCKYDLRSIKKCYIRGGNIPENEKSKDYSKKPPRNLKGVSVFECYYINDEYIPILPVFKKKTKNCGMPTRNLLSELESLVERPVYLVDGDFIGFGPIGEPLLKNVVIKKQIDINIYGLTKIKTNRFLRTYDEKEWRNCYER